MRNPESAHTILPEDHKHDQPTTKHGRELDNAKRLEGHKESTEFALNNMLDFLSLKLGKEVTLNDLALEFGHLGKVAQSSFQAAMNDKDEGEFLINRARFFDAKTKLLRQVEAQQ